jgi:hypothetical protein
MEKIKAKLINAGFHVLTTADGLVVSLYRKVYLSEIQSVLINDNVNLKTTTDGKVIVNAK